MGVLLLTLAYVIDFLASFYKDSQTYISVGDLLLDHIPTINLEFMFTWVMIGITLLIFLYPILFRPEIVPFTIKCYAFLLYIRSFCILLTNVGPPHGFFFDSYKLGQNIIDDMIFRNDLFFSGHTAFPFLAFLIFRDRPIKWVFLAGSILEGITVLLMHVHYSIDVVAAFFIAYGSYSICRKIFHPLNMRFATSIKLYGWDAKQRLKDFSNS
jgi:membrane-associated phospholipid phosphatase